jgi:hypothetical protein
VSRLEEFGISKMAEGPVVTLYVRGECIAAAGGPNGTNQGGTGLMTEHGLAYLVWRDGVALLASKGGEVPAIPEQVEAIRKFTEDLKTALST